LGIVPPIYCSKHSIRLSCLCVQYTGDRTASILFEKGYDPEGYLNRGEIFKELNIDLNKYNQHNALDDAKLVKETYLKLRNKK